MTQMPDGKTALAEILAVLDSAYEGPWELDEYHVDDRPNGRILSAHGTIIAEICGYIDSCGNRENGEYIVACSPERILAIAAYVRELERKRG